MLNLNIEFASFDIENKDEEIGVEIEVVVFDLDISNSEQGTIFEVLWNIDVDDCVVDMADVVVAVVVGLPN